MLISNISNGTKSNTICIIDPILTDAKINLTGSYITSLVVSLFIIFANGIFLLLYATNSRLRRGMKLLYVVLSLSDFLFGLFLLSVLSIILSTPFSEQCRVRNVLITGGFAFCNMTLTSIASILMEIYLALMRPFSHVSRRENNTISKILVVVWIPCIGLPVVSRLYHSQLWDIYFIISGSFMVILQCFVILVQSTIFVYVKRVSTVRGRDKRAAVTSVIFTTTYFISFMPLAVVGIYSKFSINELSIESYVIPWIYIMAAFNCITDPIISLIRTPNWRKMIFAQVIESSTSV